ncbi:MAG: VWA domain-containing protein [Acidimicrobiales bacterium]|nr:VWA domain-containing protein [Acidimicrobiales bacterium]
MMSRVFRVALAALLLLASVFSAAALAQDGGPEDAPPSTAPSFQPDGELDVLGVLRRSVDIVDVIVAAPGELVGEQIPTNSWFVSVDGVSQSVKADRLEGDDLEVVMLLDVSGSMDIAAMNAAKAAASRFVDTLPVSTAISIVQFGDEASVLSSLGAPQDELFVAIDGLRADRQAETALYDAVLLGLDQFTSAEDTGRTLVVLSDGDDTVNPDAASLAATAVAEREVDIVAIGLETSDSNDAALEDLVAPAGGRLLAASDASLEAVYNDLASVLSNQYRLSFEPAALGAGDVFLLLSTEQGQFGSFVSYEAAELVPAPAPPAAAPVNPATSESAITLPAASIVPEPAWWADDSIRLIGLGLLALAIAAIGYLLAGSSDQAVQLASAGRDRSVQAIGGAPERLTGIADSFLERGERGALLERALDRAGIALRPAEFVVLAAVFASIGGLLGFLFAGPVAALLFAGLILFGSRMWVSFKISRRRRMFEEQLGSTVQLLAGSLRAGYAVPQAAETVANEAESPTADEFHRLVTEHRLGRDFSESMNAMADRVESQDFRWVVQAIAIHREVGGDLAEVLDNVGATIRDREFIRRQFQAMSAEGRYSAYLILSLPFVVLAVLSVGNPEYIDVLFNSARGFITLTVAGTLMFVGGSWLFRLIRPQF